MSDLDLDPQEFFEGTVLEEFAEHHREKAQKLIEEFGDEEQDMEFRGMEFIFTPEDESFEQRTKIHQDSYHEEDFY